MTVSEKVPHEPRWITCRCGAKWTALNAAHCGSCHQTFSGSSLFDLHRSVAGPHGTCRGPSGITNNRGERVMFYRNGMWRGPELTEDQKARFVGGKDESTA